MNKLIVIIACLSLALVVGLTLTWPKYQNLQDLRSNLTVKETELQSKEEYFSQIKEISQELEQYADALDKISSALPETSNLPSLFNFLQMSASQAGLVLEEIILDKVQEGEIQATCQLVGDYSSLKNFLLALENSARMIEVENISFASPEKTGKPFEFRIQIKTHSYGK